jgi:hypothetical protein
MYLLTFEKIFFFSYSFSSGTDCSRKYLAFSLALDIVSSNIEGYIGILEIGYQPALMQFFVLFFSDPSASKKVNVNDG